MSTIFSKQNETPKVRCLIVDDEEIAIEGIRDYLNDLPSFVIVDTCLSAVEAMEILKTNEIDLMFLDINMPRLNGMDFLELLENPPLTIITTAYSEYALDGFRLHVVDYLLKPYTFQRFLKATQKATDLFKSKLMIEHADGEKSWDMYIRQEDAYKRINWEEIMYVEAMQNYMKLHFKDQVFIIHQTMVSLEEILPSAYFFRIHNSYLVNIKHIDKISGGRLVVNGEELPISKHRKEAFLKSVVYKNLISK